jgi:integrase
LSAAQLGSRGPIDFRRVSNALASSCNLGSRAEPPTSANANPCRGVARREVKSRERVLGDSEIPKFWNAFTNAGEAGIALKVLLLTAQRPGEITAMRREHIADNWWTLPGDTAPALGWPGTKNGEPNRIFLPAPVRELISAGENSSAEGAVFAKGLRLPAAMRKICEDLGVERATPHDLRRTCATLLARLRVGGDVADRILNHKDRTVRSTYDRYSREVEIKRAMERTPAHILALAERRPDGVVIRAFN